MQKVMRERGFRECLSNNGIGIAIPPFSLANAPRTAFSLELKT